MKRQTECALDAHSTHNWGSRQYMYNNVPHNLGIYVLTYKYMY